MDNLRGQFGSFGHDHDDEPDDYPVDSDDTGRELPPSPIGQDERRMQVRAYNHWASLLADRNYPAIESLAPETLDDFGPYSVLLDFGNGIENPGIRFLGEKLAEECGTSQDLATLNDVPSRSLLSRITDHYMQILANQAPIGFEAEFVNQRGATILYRGILLPYSSDDETIDYIYGVINWKELADQLTSDELLLEIDQALMGEDASTDATDVVESEANDPLATPILSQHVPAMPSASNDADLPSPSFGLLDEDSEDAAETSEYDEEDEEDDERDLYDAIEAGEDEDEDDGRFASLLSLGGVNVGEEDEFADEEDENEGDAGFSIGVDPYAPRDEQPAREPAPTHKAKVPLDLSAAMEVADDPAPELGGQFEESVDEEPFELSAEAEAEMPSEIEVRSDEAAQEQSEERPVEPPVLAEIQDEEDAATDEVAEQGAFELTDAVSDEGSEEAEPVAAVESDPNAGLYDCLAEARELAQVASSSEDRSRKALYAAVGRAYDVSLIAAAQPDDFAELVADSGLTIQDRAPMTPVVKLVFGADYDKTRLTEYAAVLAHAHRNGVARGELAGFLGAAEGGLKGVVEAERQLRREESGVPAKRETPREALARKLRKIAPLGFEDIAEDGPEFALVMIRRDGAGNVVVLGEIADDVPMVEKAGRKIVAASKR
ncbi:hypothetical protein [Tsuneonella mangrovi]|uniref:hypothetical protein n=1 Tax=Tsuneonella mangrovi TaxID=1982042 RepID=UPI003B835D5D